jgi:coenzyme PQQ precursor peptide PqqA
MRRAPSDCRAALPHSHRQGEKVMQWTTPSFTDMRFGFEITMYIATR